MCPERRWTGKFWSFLPTDSARNWGHCCFPSFTQNTTALFPFEYILFCRLSVYKATWVQNLMLGNKLGRVLAIFVHRDDFHHVERVDGSWYLSISCIQFQNFVSRQQLLEWNFWSNRWVKAPHLPRISAYKARVTITCWFKMYLYLKKKVVCK